MVHDLRKVTRLNSSDRGAITALRTTGTDARGGVAVAGASRAVQRVCDAAGRRAVLPMGDDVHVALRALHQPTLEN